MHHLPPHQVLLVEDEPDIASVLQLHLSELGTSVTHAMDGVSGLAEALHGNWSLILLDLNLPRLDGIEICKQIRRFHPLLPIMMITARATEQDRLKGFEHGADHYISKPFSVIELMAQIKAVLRQVEHRRVSIDRPIVSDTISIGELVLTPKLHKASIAGEEVSLTAREFDLLLYFAKSPGCVFSRQQLLEDVWGYTHKGYMHTVNSHINRLRAKIEPDPAKPSYIQTVWGVGYKLSP
ncbi:MAG: response regulator transcription factor [Gammaproteobacteria bacterium]|nr:response regulator transcription factor [Gammaproteobacteria bacterium]